MNQIGFYEKEINIVLNITNLEALLLYIAIYKYTTKKLQLYIRVYYTIHSSASFSDTTINLRSFRLDLA